MPRKPKVKDPKTILHEFTSDDVAAIAGRVLVTGRATAKEVRVLAASVLTQARPRDESRQGDS